MLDDNVDFLRSVKQRERESHVEFLTTTEPMESLQWVEQGRAPILVSDLVLEHPDWDGLDVLERAHTRKPTAHLKLLTGYSLNVDQRRRAREINAEVYLKSDGTAQLFEDILVLGTASSVDGRDASEQALEEEHRRRIYRLLISDLIDDLSRIPEPESQYIVRGAMSFSVADLIRELEAGSGTHALRYVDLWVKAKKQLRDMGRNP